MHMEESLCMHTLESTLYADLTYVYLRLHEFQMN